MNTGLYDARIREAAAARVPARISSANFELSRDNPLCGDRVVMQARVQQGRFQELCCVAEGCLLCKASAAVLNAHASGMATDEAPMLLAALTLMLEGRCSAPGAPWEALEMFLPLVEHRNRRKCVLLPFQVLACVDIAVTAPKKHSQP